VREASTALACALFFWWWHRRVPGNRRRYSPFAARLDRADWSRYLGDSVYVG
jgi:hypothetical protein